MGFFTVVTVYILQSPSAVLIAVSASKQIGILDRDGQQIHTGHKQEQDHILTDPQDRGSARWLPGEHKCLDQAQRTLLMINVCVSNVVCCLQKGGVWIVKNTGKRGITVNIFTINPRYKHRYHYEYA